MFVSLLACCGVLRAGGLFVDQANPKADDKNTGAIDAPFKTIQAAMDKAKAGDTVEVRAGVYRESVAMKHSGSHFRIPYQGYWDDPDPDFITLEAYKDEHVVVDGSEIIPAAKWDLAAGCKNTYAAPFESKAWQGLVNMVFSGETMLMPTLVKNPDRNQPDTPLLPTMPGDGASDQGYYYDKAQKKLYVNLGGQAPGKDAEMSVAQQGAGIDAHNQSFVRIRKLEIRRFNQGGVIVCDGTNAVVQDNYIHYCGQGLDCGSSAQALIHRNIISDIMTVGMGAGGVHGTVVESNVIKRFHYNPYKLGNYSGSFMCNGSFGLIIRNNIITEPMSRGAGGPWPDCASMGIAGYGNTIYRVTDHGFYIEAGVYGTVLRWNTVFENDYGITFRGNNANTAFENYVFNNRGQGLAMGTPDQEDTDPKANRMTYNWVINNGVGVNTGPNGRGEIANAFDHNTYQLAPNGLLLQYGPKQYKDIASVRADLGQEIHGKIVDKFDPAPLGLVTFRVNGTKKHWEPIPMFGNPSVKRSDLVQNNDELYFWRRGDLQDGYTDKWRCEGFGGMGGTARGSRQDGFLRQFFVSRVGPTEAYPGAKVDKGVDDATAARSNGVCLQVSAAPGKSITAEGLGYWSVDLPTTDGAQIDLSLWIRASKIKAAAGGGGVYAIAEFCDATGQNATRQYLAGGAGDAKPAGADFVEGTYAYKKLSGMVTAPAGARWFRMGFGLRDCSGWAAFDDFDIQTRPGVAEAEAVVKRAIETEKYDWRVADISKLFNRPLADGDGKVGWTGQGPLMDLRGLQAGDYKFNGVPFRVEKGNACFIMKNKKLPSENLPNGGKVELKGKADMLVFLHSGGWLDPDIKHATYIIHYADGSKAELPIIGGKNIWDWTAPADRVDDQKYDPALGLILHAVTVPSPQFVRVNVWMTIWQNPHPDREIVELEVKGENEGIPGLIGVSLGVAK
jgi:parallel beta-helix repeat protein